MFLKTKAVLLAGLLAFACTAQPTPVPVPPTPTPTAPAPTPASAVTPTPAVTGTPRPRLYVVVRTETPSVRTGNKQSSTAETLPGALCAATVTDPTGERTPGLFPKQADAEGKASWSWTVSRTTAQGASKVTVRCILGTDEASGIASFQVFPG